MLQIREVDLPAGFSDEDVPSAPRHYTDPSTCNWAEIHEAFHEFV